MNVNKIQVQSTNDACTVSKFSTASKGYFEDRFIKHFVENKHPRTSLIHLGYYTRAVIVYTLVTEYIEFLRQKQIQKFQIISCGSGFDTIYYRLSDSNLISEDSLFIEIDFPNVIKKKISLIKNSPTLMSNQVYNKQEFPGVNQLKSNYYLIEGDLTDMKLVENLLTQIDINYCVPTLFLSECVITYMKENYSSQLLKWMASRFSNCCFINYEQIHPEDGFGEVMLRHFDKAQSSLYSLSKYPNCKAHYFRYKNHGFESSYAISEWDAMTWLTTEEERTNALSLELFDEYEEFHLKCVHYVVAIAGNQITLDWIKSFPVSETSFIEVDALNHVLCLATNKWSWYIFQNSRTLSNICNRNVFTTSTSKAPVNGMSTLTEFYLFIDKRVPLQLDWVDQSFELYRHALCSSKDVAYVFGGCSKHKRSSTVFKVSRRDFLTIETIESVDDTNVQLDIVYGCVTHFEIDKVPYICLYGGRTSPEKICNNGSVVIFQLIDNKLMVKSVIESTPIPRYRASMVSLNQNDGEVDCWLFGGRTADISIQLSDLWQLSLHHDSDKNIIGRWRSHEKKAGNWPSSRMSHSCVACPKRFALFITGGLKSDTSIVLDDVWKWCCGSQSWQKLELSGKFLPRYGHTSHIINDQLFLVGGVNTLAGMQPNLAVIDLNNLSVTEFVLEVPSLYPFLFFNHTSFVSEDDDDAQILVVGGGGNCFSFGTHLNKNIRSLRLSKIQSSLG